MNITLNLLYILLLFWLSASFASAIYLESLNETSIQCSIKKTKNGRFIINLNNSIVLVQAFLMLFAILICGTTSLIIQDWVFSAANKTFNLSLLTALDSNIEYAVAIVYGFAICTGYYLGKSWALNKLAESLLAYIEKTTTNYHYSSEERYLIIQKCLELRRQNLNE